jgi:hypothetical protein
MENKYQVMPPLTEEEFAALKGDIAVNGIRVAVVKDAEGHTIDGYHRERAWRKLKDAGHEVPDYPIEVRSDLETEVGQTLFVLRAKVILTVQLPVSRSALSVWTLYRIPGS